MTKKSCELVELLKSEYGISTMRELDEAIKNLGFVDISPFCVNKTTTEGEDDFD